MSDSSRKILIERYLAAYNAFDVEGMLELLSPDIRFENYSNGELTAAADSIEAFRRLAEQAKVLFSEREQRLTALAFEADTAIASIAYRGRLAMDIPDGPAAGSVLELQGKTVFTFDDGKIVKIVDRS